LEVNVKYENVIGEQVRPPHSIHYGRSVAYEYIRGVIADDNLRNTSHKHLEVQEEEITALS
jgi:hypothetical protein